MLFSLYLKYYRDGFSPDGFHKKCDMKGPTLSILKSKDGYLFGGYTETNFESSAEFTTHMHPISFIFTLTNPHNIPPTKYYLNPEALISSL